MIRGRIAVLSLASLAALLGACADAGAVDVSIPDGAIAETGWEAEFSADEMTTWRQGHVRRVTEGIPREVDELPVLAGARVELYAPRPGGRPPLAKVAETVTDTDGAFRLGPGPAGCWAVRAREGDGPATLAGRAPLLPGIFPAPDGDFHVLVRDGHPLEVVVVDAAHEPVPGVPVRASTMGFAEEATTDAAGVARFVAPSGALLVEAVEARRGGARAVFEVPAAPDGPPYRLEAPVREPLEGWVVDAETGAPLVGAVVLHLDTPELRTTTDARGRFSLEARREGRIAALGRGRAWRSYPVPQAGDVELRLGTAPVLRGRVVTQDGTGVPGARLRAVTRNVEGWREPVLGPVTGPDGAFEFQWLPRPPRGSEVEVSVVAHRRGMGWSDVLVVGDAPGDVELRLGGERTVGGTLRREGGDGLAGQSIVVAAAPADVHPAVAALLGLSWNLVCSTGADGCFETGGLPAQLAVDLTLEVDATRIVRSVEPGGDARVDIEIPRGKSIAGRVVDVDGQPVTLGGTARAELLNHPDFAELVREAPIGPDGTFVLENLPDGRYGVKGEIATFDVGGAVAEAGRDDVELIAERPSALHFEVVFPDGAEPERVAVRLDDATDPAVPPRTVVITPDDSGARGALPLVRHGRYHVTAAGGAWRCRLRDVEVADGPRPPLRLVLGRTLVRSLVLEDAAGEPLAGRRVIVAAVGRRSNAPEQFVTGEGGAVEIGGLDPGEWLARVVDEGRPPLEHRFTVSPDDRDEIRLRYPPYGTLEVSLDRAVLGDVSDAIVSLTGADGQPEVAWGPRARSLASRWRLPADGALELRGVPAGSVTVTLSSASIGTLRGDAEVRAGARATLILR